MNNLKSKIQNPKSDWRKGWDSNPRNPFEVHYISNVANSTALAPFHFDMEFGIKYKNPKSKIQNPKSDWRRGWDLNPRYRFRHSDFRDRCTKPLCDLSANKKLNLKSFRRFSSREKSRASNVGNLPPKRRM